MSAVTARDVTVTLGGARVLDGVTLTVAAGEWVGLIGPNGAGKSTLLRALAGLVRHDGEVRLGGEPLPALARRDIARRVAFVPQKPPDLPWIPVRDFVHLGRTPHLGRLGREGRADRAAVDAALARLDLRRLADRRLGSLSGGELQRAALARAVAQDAPVLLLDEPTAALDLGRRQQALALVAELRAERGLTVVAAMHDLTLAGLHADRLVLLDRGCVAADGPPRDVLEEGLLAARYGAAVQVVDAGGVVAVVPAPTGGPRWE
ncbi:MAG: ABC transporter ATP-binding protein [Actinomycetota bacterium]